MTTITPTTPSWLSPAALEPLHRVNDQCLALMIDLAGQRDPPPESFLLVETLRSTLIRLTNDVRRRAGEQYFLIVDFEFRNPQWWQHVRSRPDQALRTASSAQPAPRPRVVTLARATLTLAWHIAKAERVGAAVLLGMDASVAELLTTFSPNDLSRLADRHAHHLVPRWFDRPVIWQRLLRAARSGERKALRAVRVQGLQLLGGDLLPRLN